jgi:hypothetical protein
MAGSDWAHGMQRATTTAERLVVVLSAAYLQSGHGEAEWRPYYAKDPSGEHGLLLPVRVGDVEPPGLLKTRIYVDLIGRDANSARATLLAAARRVRGKPTSEPEFPGTAGPSMSHGTEAPQFPGEAENKKRRPAPSGLPPELLEAISSEAVGRRVEAVAELGRLLHAAPGEVAEQARALLQQLIDDDSRPVSRAAIRALSTRPTGYWTRGKIELLHAELAYPGARALLDEAAHRAPRSVLLREVSERTGSRTEQISAELGAMTKLCKRLFGRDAWPVTVRSTADGASYQMDAEIAQWWRQASDPDTQPTTTRPLATSTSSPDSGLPNLTPALEIATRVAADHRQGRCRLSSSVSSKLPPTETGSARHSPSGPQRVMWPWGTFDHGCGPPPARPRPTTASAEHSRWPVPCAAWRHRPSARRTGPASGGRSPR